MDLSFRSLSRSTKLFLIASLFNMIGNGMILAFLFIYLSKVQGFSKSWSGWLMASSTLVTIALTSLGGSIVDRIGARRSLLISLGAATIIYGLYIWATTIPIAFAVSVAAGVTTALMQPSQQAFSVTIVADNERSIVSSWVRVVINIGAGIGATVASLFVRVDRPATFTALFLINCASYLTYLVIVFAIHPRRGALPHADGRGFRDVVRDRFFVRLVALDLATGISFGLTFLVMTTTFLKELGATEKTIGLVFASGTIVVILAQLPVAKFVRGKSRMRALAVMCMLFAVAQLLALISVDRTLNVVVGLVVAAQVIGGIAEACMGPVRNPLTADLAPPELMGRYFGFAAVFFQGGWAISNALGGMGLDWSIRGTWVFGIAVAGFATVWALRLDREIPTGVRLA